jgi:hypothetical protein
MKNKATADIDSAESAEQRDDKGPSFWQTLRRLGKESWIPLLLAALYAGWDTRASRGSLQLGPFIKVFGPAFFFLMWLVGQFLRVKKQLQDRELLVGINSDVRAIRAALGEKAAAEGVPPSKAAPIAIIQDPVAADMMQQAEIAFASQLSLPALLVAAAAFEHSIRAAGQRYGTAVDSRAPIPRILASIADYLPRGVTDELRLLWDARNKLVHLRDTRIDKSADAQGLLDGFRRAIVLLSNLGPPPPPPAAAQAIA